MNPVIQGISVLLQVYSYVLLARALVSWIPNRKALSAAEQAGAKA